MYVITADQRASRKSGDAVPQALERLGSTVEGSAWGLYRPFERTAGDEIQGALTDAASALRVVLWLLRTDRWHVGLGIGPVEEPVPTSVRSARGPAFHAARAAVEAARRVDHHVAVRAATGSPPPAPDGPAASPAQGRVGGAGYGRDDRSTPAASLGDGVDMTTAGPADARAHAGYAEAGLWLLCRVLSARTPAGWQAVDLAAGGATGRQIAERFAISPAAVSQRLARAGWSDEKAAIPLIEHHLWMADLPDVAGLLS